MNIITKTFTHETKADYETVRTPDIDRSRWRVFHGATNAQMALWAVFGPYIEEAAQQQAAAQQPAPQSNVTHLDDYRPQVEQVDDKAARESAARDLLTQVSEDTAPELASVTPITAAPSAQIHPFDLETQARHDDALQQISAIYPNKAA